MAMVYDPKDYPDEQPQQIPYITEDIARAAQGVQSAADDYFKMTQSHASVPLVKKFGDTIKSIMPAVYPVEVGAPTGPYINVLLEKRKQMADVEEAGKAGGNSVKPEDEDAAAEAYNMWQRFSMAFMMVLFNFEEGLSPDQRW